ncbi:sugar-binding transcriptional regulator [Sporolactobacillus pectinivorans]|uniref:sugar-binding transcriptional regulator n=1 Tax=Sporolactobacillus pectinivorans TaxID=1591408 RepID=UPI000C266412|nr:sugar-binding transcriptional regulator [Sporolactobacillus pectinivorans]
MDSIEMKKLYINIAQMYYDQNMTQNQIAQRTGINRTSISRILKKIREDGIVKIIINYDLNNVSLAQKLRNRFNLKYVSVVPVNSEQQKRVRLTAIGQACAKFLEQVVEDNDVIGLSWGSTLASVVEALAPSAVKNNVSCVPIVGGPSGKLESQYHVNTICYGVAQKFRGKSLLIDFPAIVEKTSMKNDILETHYYKEIDNMWDHISIAVFGVGSLQIAENSTWHAFYGDKAITKLKSEGVAGDICSRFYDINGAIIQTHLSDRTISIQLDKLRKARYAIGVAESVEKVPGIIGALRGHYMNVLITTEETATAILEETD